MECFGILIFWVRYCLRRAILVDKWVDKTVVQCVCGGGESIVNRGMCGIKCARICEKGSYTCI